MADSATNLDLSSLSPKQQDMALARSPSTGQEMNAQNMERSAQNRQLDEQRKGIATRQQAEQQGLISPTSQQGGQATGNQAAGQVQRNLSSFSNRIAAKMNQFASGGDVSQLAMDLPSEFKPTWDEATQQFVVPDIQDLGYDVSDIARTKAEQIAEMKQAYSPYFDYSQIGDQTQVRAKSFADTLKQFADLDGDGQIDPEEQRYLDESFQIAEMLQRLEKLNPDSAEAASIRMQLEMLDKEGLVSGIYRALDQYKEITGESGKGPTMYGGLGSESVDFENIINMSTAKIEQELMKAITGQESFFGGDFATALNSNRLRTNLEKSLAFDSRTRTELARAAAAWGEELNDTFDNYKTEINDAFKSVAEERIPAYFERLRSEMEARGEDTASLDAAMQWFDDIANGEQDAASAIWELLNDEESGLSVNQRSIISKWIGSATGENTTNGILAGVLDSLAKKGYVDISVTNPDTGQEERKVVEFSDKDRLKVANILGNDALDDNQKRAAINRIVSQAVDARISASGDLKAMEQYFADGNLETGLEVFVESLVNSLNTFNQSFTQHAYNQIMEDRKGEFTEGMPEGGDPRDYTDPKSLESIQGAAQDIAKTIEDRLKSIEEHGLGAIGKRKERAQQDLTDLNAVEGNLNTAWMKGRQSVTDTFRETVYENGLQNNSVQIFSTLSSLNLKDWRDKKNSGIPMPDFMEVSSLNPEDVTSIAEAFTILKNINMLYGDNASQVGVRDSYFYKMYAPYIADPMKLIRSISVSNGDVSPLSVEMSNKIVKSFSALSGGMGQKIFENTSIAKNIVNKRKEIERARDEAHNFLREADQFEAYISGYIDNATRVLEGLRAFNPKEIANLAMKMAKAADEGRPFDITEYVDMSKMNITKEDFDKAYKGDFAVRPMYTDSAVADLDSTDTDYSVVKNPQIDPELLQWAKDNGFNLFEGPGTGLDYDFSRPIPDLSNIIRL